MCPSGDGFLLTECNIKHTSLSCTQWQMLHMPPETVKEKTFIFKMCDGNLGFFVTCP